MPAAAVYKKPYRMRPASSSTRLSGARGCDQRGVTSHLARRARLEQGRGGHSCRAGNTLTQEGDGLLLREREGERGWGRRRREKGALLPRQPREARSAGLNGSGSGRGPARCGVEVAG